MDFSFYTSVSITRLYDEAEFTIKGSHIMMTGIDWSRSKCYSRGTSNVSNHNRYNRYFDV
jgi:hypothetical protein